MDNSQLTPQIRALLQSQEAQQLAQLLSQTNGNAVQQATQAAQQGDEAAVREAIAPLLRDPAVAALLQRLSGQGGV